MFLISVHSWDQLVRQPKHNQLFNSQRNFCKYICNNRISMLSGSSMSRRKWIKYTGIALLLSLVPNNNVATGDTTTLESISPKEAYERVHGHYSVPLIDVRTKEEYASTHIDGSISIPLSDSAEWIASVKKLFPLDAHLVLICQKGIRSSNAAQQLIQAGYSHVSVVRGGLNEWKRQGIPWNIR